MQSLIVPNKVHNSHNNADTYKVYDPNEAIGDTMPTAAKPPQKQKTRQSMGMAGVSMVGVARIELATPAMSTKPETEKWGISAVFNQFEFGGITLLGAISPKTHPNLL